MQRDPDGPPENGRINKQESKGRPVSSAAEMASQAQRAANFMKTLSHQGRLMILCHLLEGERTVGEIEELLQWRQAAVSQQLARLRVEGLVDHRRDGKVIYYEVTDDAVKRTVALLYEIFCQPKQEK